MLGDRNPLAYPCGVAPGFDPSHVAACGMSSGHGFSAVCFPGGAVNLLNGLPGSQVGVTFRTYGHVGPVVDSNAGANVVSFAGQLTVADTSLTMAGIFLATSLAANASVIANSSSGAAGIEMYITPTGAIAIRVVGQGVSYISTGTPIAANKPYFAAISSDGTIYHTVMRNLADGTAYSETQSLGPKTFGASNGTYGLGRGAFASSVPGGIAAGMFGPRLVSMAALQQWAADPWSFWYPQRD